MPLMRAFSPRLAWQRRYEWIGRVRVTCVAKKRKYVTQMSKFACARPSGRTRDDRANRFVHPSRRQIEYGMFNV
jgi:hypothetical protein